MDPSDYEEIWEHEIQRVRIYRDDQCEDLWDSNDHLGVIVPLTPSGTSTDQDAEPVIQAYLEDEAIVTVADLLDALAGDFGATAVLGLEALGEGYSIEEWLPGTVLREVSIDAIAFDSEQARGSLGTPLDKVEEVLRHEVQQYTSWATGDVWVAALESKDIWQPTDGPTDFWDVDDSVGGLVGRDHAVEVAAEYFPEPDEPETSSQFYEAYRPEGSEGQHGIGIRAGMDMLVWQAYCYCGWVGHELLGRERALGEGETHIAAATSH